MIPTCIAAGFLLAHGGTVIKVEINKLKDKTKACYNCGCYAKVKKVFRCAVDNVSRKHNSACTHITEFFYKDK